MTDHWVNGFIHALADLPILLRIMPKKQIYTLIWAACCFIASSSAVQAQTTAALTGFMGKRALIMIDGGTPRVVEIGATVNGIKLLSIDAKKHLAEVEINGTPNTLRLIGMPSSYGSRPPGAKTPNDGLHSAGASDTTVTIPMSGDGHFYVDGYINGHAHKFMVDTGASTVVIGEDDAVRMGIDYKRKGSPVQMSTANGAVEAYAIKLDSLVIGGIEEKGVDAVIGSNIPFILLGNSFLSRLKMQRNSNTMLLGRAQ